MIRIIFAFILVLSIYSFTFYGDTGAIDEPVASIVPAVSFSNLSLSRSRLEHQVFYEGRIKNEGNEKITGASLHLICLGYNLKSVKESEPLIISSLPPYFTKDFKIIIKQCPYFSTYKIKLKYCLNGEEYEFFYHASDLASPPLLERKVKGMASLMVLSHYIEEKVFNCYVKNEGDIDAEETAAILKFYNAKKQLMREINLPMEDGRAEKEKTRHFKVKIKDCLDYTYYQISLKYVSLKEEEKTAAEAGKIKYEDKEYGEFTPATEV